MIDNVNNQIPNNPQLNGKSLFEVFELTAKKNLDNIAASFYGKHYSYKTMLELTERAAAALDSLKIKKGDVVTLCIPNTPSAIIAFYALNKLGVIVNLVHPKVPVVQLNESMKKTNSCALICYDLYLKGNKPDFDGLIILSKSNHFMGAIAKTYFRIKNKKIPKNYPIFEALIDNNFKNVQTQRFNEKDAAAYLPSGGTTGSPKIIMHCNKAFIDLCNYAQHCLSENIENYKCMYTVLPIFHGFGLCMNMHLCMQFGFKNVMSLKFDTKALAKAVKAEGVNILMGVPSMFNKLLKCKHFVNADLSPIKDCFVGGDTVAQTLIDEFNSVLKRQGSLARLYEGYGLTETVTVNAVSNKNHFKSGSAGVALPGTQIKILLDGNRWAASRETGEIAINSHIFMLGYLGADESPIRHIDGKDWLLTGDLAYIDEDGYIFFKQRRKNLIKVSGVPVFPSEIEEAVLRVNGVAKAAAIGVFDESAGQAVKLFLELSDINLNHEQIKRAVIDECKRTLISYSVPKYIEIENALPLNEMGKIDRTKLA